MSDALRIRFVRLAHGRDLPLPFAATKEAAGYDLTAAIETGETLTIAQAERKLIPTGLKLALPSGFEAQVRPRSGLALKHGVTVLNAPGTIDSDYRGELSVLLINHGSEGFCIRRGDRIAQLVVSKLCPLKWEEVETLPESERGEDGYGSTGRR